MPSSSEKICRQCHGTNPAGSTYCWYCGARLRGLFLRPGGRVSALRLLLRGSKWLLAMAVLAGVAYGVYYSLDRLVWPAVSSRETQEANVITTLPASSTTTTTIPRVDRQVGGGSRYATAIAVSKLAFPAGAAALVLVAGDDSVDALPVGPLAAAYGAPILLMPPEGLSSDLSAEITRLGPQEVFLVGISNPQTARGQLGEMLGSPAVTDLTGSDPYETAANIAMQVKTKLGGVSKVVIAPSDSFLEAIAVTPLASASGWPILLAPQQGELPGPTAKALADLQVTSALVVGTAVPLTEVSDVERRVGTDSLDTVALIVQYALEQGVTFQHTAIASGDDFPDGLVTESLLARTGGILLLTQEGRLPAQMQSLFDANRAAIRTLDFIALPSLAKAIATPDTDTTDTTTGETATGDTNTTGAE